MCIINSTVNVCVTLGIFFNCNKDVFPLIVHVNGTLTFLPVDLLVFRGYICLGECVMFDDGPFRFALETTKVNDEQTD